MATQEISKVVEHLRSALLRDGAGMTDGELLQSFIAHRDEAAFAALMRRHGLMVWRVCQRVLRNSHDAEDAFQAAFLVLVRKAASIASRHLLANWLYGVAYRTALKAKAAAVKRRVREKQVMDMPEPAVVERDLSRDLQPPLDQELSRLPDRYRAVVILCDLEGKTRKEAARQLRVPEGTIAGRLARARAMLGKQLSQRGFVLSSGSLAVLLSPNAASALPPTSLVSSTIKAAALFAAGQFKGIVSAKVTTLTEGVLRMLLLDRLKLGTAACFVVALLASLGWFLFPTQAGQPRVTPQTRPSGLNTRKDPEELNAATRELHGAWQLTRAEWDGQNQLYALKPLGDWTWSFRGSAVSVKVEALEGNARHAGDFTVNADKTPKEMDFTLLDAKTKEGPRTAYKAIYVIEGDTLQIAYAKDSDARPATFTTKRGDGAATVVLTLKRAAAQTKEASAAPGKQGRIYVLRRGRFASFDPETKAEAWHSPLVGLPYQCKISPDGKWMAYGLIEYVEPVPPQQEEPEGDALERVYIRHLETQETIALGLRGQEYSWSRDGRFLVVSRVDDFKTFKTSNHLVDVRTRQITELALPEGHLIVDWSLDGQSFLTTTVAREGERIRNQLHLVKRDGTEVRALSKQGETAGLARFSPDGGKCVWLRSQEKDGATEDWVEVLEIATGKRTRISQERNAENLGFCWSPDGQRIAYVWRQKMEFKTQEDRTRFDGAVETFLMIVNADGSNPETLLSERWQGVNAPVAVTLAMPDWR